MDNFKEISIYNASLSNNQDNVRMNVTQMLEDHSLSEDIASDKEFIILFLENKREGSEETARSYAYEIVSFLRFVGYPSIDLERVTFKMCIAYRNFLKDSERNYASSTITRKLNIVSSLYNFGISIGYFDNNPIASVVRPKVPEPEMERYLTYDETKKLLKELQKNPRNYLIAIILITTGLRSSEIRNIRWKDFYQDGKGNIGLKVLGKGRLKRSVKIRRDVWSYILEFRTYQNRSNELDPNDESYLILNRSGNPLSGSYLRRMIKENGKRAGIKKDISTHWLRHTSASMAINNGADIKTCMESYGWKNMKTAQRYIHDIKKLEKTAVDFIDIDV